MVAIRECIPTTVARRQERSSSFRGPYLVNRVRTLPIVHLRPAGTGCSVGR